MLNLEKIYDCNRVRQMVLLLARHKMYEDGLLWRRATRHIKKKYLTESKRQLHTIGVK